MIHSHLEFINMSKDLMIEIHRLTLLLSQMQIFDEGRPINESFSAITGLAASHVKKRYNYEFIKSLVTYHSGQDNDQLEALFTKGSLTPENLFAALKTKLERLGTIINGLKQPEENAHTLPQ